MKEAGGGRLEADFPGLHSRLLSLSLDVLSGRWSPFVRGVYFLSLTWWMIYPSGFFRVSGALWTPCERPVQEVDIHSDCLLDSCRTIRGRMTRFSTVSIPCFADRDENNTTIYINSLSSDDSILAVSSMNYLSGTNLHGWIVKTGVGSRRSQWRFSYREGGI